MEYQTNNKRQNEREMSEMEQDTVSETDESEFEC